MRSNDAFPSKYLKALDIKGREVAAIMERIEHEEMQDGEWKYVLYFENKKKGVVLNRTNWDAIEEAYEDSENWPGQPVVLFTIKTKDPSGKTVDGIRIKINRPDPPKKAAPAQQTHDELNPPDDDIPF